MNKSSYPHQNHQWIHDLVIQESQDKAFQAQDAHALVHEATHRFMLELKTGFEEVTQIFNSYAHSGMQFVAPFSEVKMYSVAGSLVDFMLFRNQQRLVVSHKNHGSIVFHGLGEEIEILADLRAYEKVRMVSKGEEVEAVSLVKYFFSKFITATQQKPQQPKPQKEIVDQIRQLLQEKGIQI